MPYIRQKNKVEQKTETIINDETIVESKDIEIIVDTSNYEGDLNKHPCLLKNSNHFEYVNKEMPEDFVLLNYVSEPQSVEPIYP